LYEDRLLIFLQIVWIIVYKLEVTSMATELLRLYPAESVLM